MKLTINIEMDNDAFQISPLSEVITLLNKFIHAVKDAGLPDEMMLMDSNGNTAFKATLQRDD